MATKKRDLRTGKPVWALKRVPYSALQHDIETQVLIIGSGISGAMIADLLTADGFNVVIVDRRKPMRGSTAASTAMVLHEIDEPLIRLSRKIGSKNATRAWDRSWQAVFNLHARISELRISCDRAVRNSLYLAGNVLDEKNLKKEFEMRKKHGLPVTYLKRNDLKNIYGISRAGAIRSSGSLVLDPVKLTAGLIKATQQKGMKIFTPVEITKVESSKTTVKAYTKDGYIIKCKYLIFCTGYEFPDYVPMKGHKIISTYAIATKPQKKPLWPKESLIWEASDPYLYLRTTKDKRIIIGGEDEEFSDDKARDKLLPEKTKILQQKLKKLFPHLNANIDYAWTGSFGTSKNGLPSIGEIPGMKNCWAVLGYSGNGITFSRIAAEIVSKALQGGKDRDADLFKF